MFWRRPAKIQPINTAPGVGKPAGITAATILAITLLIQPWENGANGKPRLTPYLDSGKVATACTGATGAEITAAYNSGRVFTEKECRAIDERNFATHAESVYRLVTYRPLPDLTGAAFISFHFNVGANQFASSTLLRKANAGDMKGACEQLPRWTRVKGVVVRGLENRRYLGDNERVSERTVCMIGLDPSYRTPLFDRLLMQVKY